MCATAIITSDLLHGARFLGVHRLVFGLRVQESERKDGKRRCRVGSVSALTLVYAPGHLGELTQVVPSSSLTRCWRRRAECSSGCGTCPRVSADQGVPRARWFARKGESVAQTEVRWPARATPRA